MAGSNGNSCTHPSAVHLNTGALSLLSAANSNRTKSSYLRSWHLLDKFLGLSSIQLPLSIPVVANFISFLHSNKYSPASVASHISAISYVHKLLMLDDPTHSFLIRKILKGCKHLGGAKDTRLPITKYILARLLGSLTHTVNKPSFELLLKSIFLLAFHAFMRMGELVCTTNSDNGTVIQCQDVAFQKEGDCAVSMDITLRHFKNNKDKRPIYLHLTSNNNSDLCPVQTLCKFCTEFPHTDGPLFQFPNGTPVSYSYVAHQLKVVTSFLGLNSSLYKCHSFRIGAATEAAQLGYSESVIQTLGRWNSGAFRNYIRINAFRM